MNWCVCAICLKIGANFAKEHFDTDIGTEELGHFEMIGAIVYQLTRNLSIEQIKASGFDTYFVDHTTGIYTVAASGAPYDAFSYASKGDVITDLHEDLAADGTIAQKQLIAHRYIKSTISEYLS